MKRNLHRPVHANAALVLALLAALFVFPRASRADALEDAARTLAAKVAAIPRLPVSAALAWENRSSLSESQSAVLRRALTLALAGGRLLLVENASVPVLRVTLSDTPAHILLIAVLQPAEAEDAILLELDRAAFPADQDFSLAARIERQLLWRQPEPLLDGIEWAEGANQESFLVLLTRDSLLRARSAKDGWRSAMSGAGVTDSAPLPASLLLPWPREGEAGFAAVSPALPTQLKIRMNRKACSVALGEKLGLSCDGEAGGAKPDPVIAAPCTRASYRLLTGGGDHNEKDWIQAVESVAGEGSRLTPRLEMPGPVLALTVRPEGNSALAIVRNLLTGDYEVYRITLACGN
ncbi:MAG: hypothetical protein LAN71_05975 [Acidobacteriia bacterium]|nr:hypothetical protein [Terriglobia bacterium]